MMAKGFATLGAFVLCAATVCAQEKDAARLDRAARMNEIMSAYTKDNDFMGSVLVADGDTVLLSKGYGLASFEWNISDAPDVKFRIASLTKQFTAAMVLQLQQEGKLQISDPVGKYLPNAPAAWGKITLANLLGHTSGISDFTNDPGYGAWDMSEHTHLEELAKIEKPPLDFEPGTKFAYSNSNYEVLGMVLEQASGQPYEKLLRERLLDPLGMASTGLDTDELVLPKRAEGYRRTNKSLVVARSESMSVPWSAASIYSTTGDLLKWEHGLFGGKVLSAESLAKMTTPGQGNYRFGLFVEPKYGERVVWHGGEIEGFNAYLGYIPDRRITVILLSNMNGGAIFNVSDKLMQAALGKTVMLQDQHRVVPITREDLAKFTGIYDVNPGLALTIALGPDGLEASGGGKEHVKLTYEGLIAGHPYFYVHEVDVEAELEFVPDENGRIASFVMHQNGDHPAKKR